ARAGFEVRLLDGSALQVPKVVANAQTITIQEPILGTLAIPATELFEIRALGLGPEPNTNLD
ncbi:MAG TPA: hypothetical protein VGF13_08710, partial [Verrucomicrobiae bacterium]